MAGEAWISSSSSPTDNGGALEAPALSACERSRG